MHDCNIILITNKSDLTSDFVVKALSMLGTSFYRFNTEDLFSSVSFVYDLSDIESCAYLIDHCTDSKINLRNINAVYYRRPGVPAISLVDISRAERNFIIRENLRLLEGIYKLLEKAFWVSPIWNIREAENKVWQLKLAREIGFIVPDTVVSDRVENHNTFINSHGNVIAKPISGGLVDENDETSSVIFTSRICHAPTEDEMVNSFVLLQQEINKKADVRVIMVGNEAFAAAIFSQEYEDSKVDWRRSGKVLRHEIFNLPIDIKNKCKGMMVRMGLNFGAFDFILTPKDDLIFLEINPNGQWAWIENLTGLKISYAIANLLCR